MKNILFAFLLISSVLKAQDDNTKVTVTIQARDCEYIGHIIAFNENYEDLFDLTKVKWRTGNDPTGNANVVIDTIPIGQWLKIDAQLRADPIAVGASVLSRVEAALRAVNNTYMNGRLDALVAIDTEIYTSRRAFGRFRYRKQ